MLAQGQSISLSLSLLLSLNPHHRWFACVQVWEVGARLLGLVLSIGLLRSIEAAHIPALVLPAWATAQAVHVLLRYQSLRQLKFAFLNHKRTCAVVNAHVRGQQVPSESSHTKSTIVDCFAQGGVKGEVVLCRANSHFLGM